MAEPGAVMLPRPLPSPQARGRVERRAAREPLTLPDEEPDFVFSVRTRRKITASGDFSLDGEHLLQLTCIGAGKYEPSADVDERGLNRAMYELPAGRGKAHTPPPAMAKQSCSMTTLDMKSDISTVL